MKLIIFIKLFILLNSISTARQNDSTDFINNLPVLNIPYVCSIYNDTVKIQLTNYWERKLNANDRSYAIGKVFLKSDFEIVIIKLIRSSTETYSEAIKMFSLKKESNEIIDSLSICEFSSGIDSGKFRYKDIEGTVFSSDTIKLKETIRIPAPGGNMEEESFDMNYKLDRDGFFIKEN